jgi:hypothetical protein
MSAVTGDGKAVEQLISHMIMHGGLFMSAVSLLPANSPRLRDPKFMADRADLSGGSSMSLDALAARRPVALSELHDFLYLLETKMLSDNRQWILNTDRPALADIEALWLIYWLTVNPGALPDSLGPNVFPKVYALLDRFLKAIDQGKSEMGQLSKVDGTGVAELISKSEFAEPEGDVDASDPWVVVKGLKKGDSVRLWPTDYGSNHKDEGILVSISNKETVIDVKGSADNIRVHAPRHGFRVEHLQPTAQEHL